MSFIRFQRFTLGVFFIFGVFFVSPGSFAEVEHVCGMNERCKTMVVEDAAARAAVNALIDVYNEGVRDGRVDRIIAIFSEKVNSYTIKFMRETTFDDGKKLYAPMEVSVYVYFENGKYKIGPISNPVPERVEADASSPCNWMLADGNVHQRLFNRHFIFPKPD